MLGGLVLLFVRAQLNSAKYLDVNDGQEPPAVYRQWRSKRLINRISKTAVFVGGAGAAAVTSGLIMFLVGYLR